MERNELRETLGRLHEELARGRPIDPEVRHLLVDVVRDIEATLEPSEEESEHTLDSLVARLREATQHFEESHPSLTSAVGQVADALSRMGI
jgi:hypothetical protein